MLDLDLQDIKDAAGLVDPSADDLVERIIARLQPVLEARIDPGLLADESAEPSLVFALTEIIAAEVVNVLTRQAFVVSPELFVASDQFELEDPFGLERRGQAVLSGVSRTLARGVATGTTELLPSKGW